MDQINKAIKLSVNECATVEELHTLVYVAASAIVELHEQKTVENLHNRENTPKIQPWERRITSKIETLRQEIGRLTQNQKGRINKTSTQKK